MTRISRVTSFAAVLAMTIILLPSVASARAAKPITLKQAATQYLRDVGPVNAAGVKFSAAFNKWGKANGTGAQTTVFVRPYATSLTLFDRKLLSQRWPVKALGDVRTLVRDDAGFVADIEELPSLNILNVSQWSAPFLRDGNAMAVSADIVRSDLGLPLAKK